MNAYDAVAGGFAQAHRIWSIRTFIGCFLLIRRWEEFTERTLGCNGFSGMK